ncbi:MAG: GSCFA domain-containing protein [Paludibacteraceae bacterium]|nr:GSCFA domain-containing protein [Paludibacteraceae bacterium]
MQLYTPIKIPKFPTITHSANIMMFGSCFALCMDRRLSSLRFNVTSNPHGITYNPVSIANSIVRLSLSKKYTQAEILEHNGLFFSPDHHGSFSSASQKETLDKINTCFSVATTFIPKTTHFILTLGSSVVYERDGKVWNNCHKLPQGLFMKRRLTVNEVYDALSPIIERYGDSRFIISVSPIRYLSDNNSTNKATLLLAVERLCETFANATYFPAYEILLDELRDYRFFADDMLHPSPLAEEIIFNRFAEAYFTQNTIMLNKAIEKLMTMQAHRPLHPDSEEYQRFKSKLQEYEKTVSDALARSRDSVDDCTIQ